MAPRKPAEAGPAAGADETITTIARVLARLIVRQSVGQGPATFRQIATQQLRVASDAEVDVIEAWMTAHPGG